MWYYSNGVTFPVEIPRRVGYEQGLVLRKGSQTIDPVNHGSDNIDATERYATSATHQSGSGRLGLQSYSRLARLEHYFIGNPSSQDESDRPASESRVLSE